MGVLENIRRKPADVDPGRLAYGMERPSNVPDVNNVAIDPEGKGLDTNARLTAAAEAAREQVAAKPQTTGKTAEEPAGGSDVLRTRGVSGWLERNYPKEDYGQRIKEMRRQKALGTFGNLATVFGQALGLGMGARSFDKVQDNSAQYDDYIRRLKDARMNYDMNRFSARMSAANADAQRAAAADEAARTRAYDAAMKEAGYAMDLAKAEKKHGYDMALEGEKAKNLNARQAQQQAFTERQNDRRNATTLKSAQIRQGGTNKYYGTVTVDGRKQDFATAADYNRAVIKEAQRLGIDIEKLVGGINPDGSGYGSRVVSEKVYKLAAEIERRAEEGKTRIEGFGD